MGPDRGRHMERGIGPRVDFHLQPNSGILGQVHQIVMYTKLAVVHPFCRQHFERYPHLPLAGSSFVEIADASDSPIDFDLCILLWLVVSHFLPRCNGFDASTSEATK